jgi:hypothetical protein
MKIEAGKYYVTRDGQKVGPMVSRGTNEPFVWFDTEDGCWSHDGEDGNACGPMGSHSPCDIISEWPHELSRILSAETIDHIAIDSLRFHFNGEMDPLQKEAFRIVLRYYGVSHE